MPATGGAAPPWAVAPPGHVEAMLVVGDEKLRLDVPGKAAYKLGRLAESCDIHIKVVCNQCRAPLLHHLEQASCVAACLVRASSARRDISADALKCGFRLLARALATPPSLRRTRRRRACTPLSGTTRREVYA